MCNKLTHTKLIENNIKDMLSGKNIKNTKFKETETGNTCEIKNTNYY